MTADPTFSRTDFRPVLPRFQKDALAGNAALIEAVRRIAGRKGITPV
jgi:hypothetical protein